MIKQFIFIVLAIVMINGCSTINSNNYTMKSLDFSDSINKNQVISIAKEHCLSKGACYKNCNISSLKITENETWHPGQWIVSFRSKNIATLDHSYLIFIDKKTGGIIHAEYTK